ncbi:GrpB family protein [Gottfriedia sp. NPDC056225]|uniref:GrpB family protein n=1 Tax=Gottfriedia sp. NPDC056225 TaxID=3345751 RepID=UPI0035DC455E
MRKTCIVPWTKEWEESYRKEAVILKAIFKDELVDIYHIGSTSIQSIGFAKPIIDILIVVRNIELIDSYNRKMMLLDYEPRGENGIPGRRYFPKGMENRTHHIHIFQVGNENIKSHLEFKEYLIEHPMDAKSYGDLKCKLAKEYPNNTKEYQLGKENFVMS